MARKYKIKRKNPGFFARLVPVSVQAFVARRIIDSVGIAFTLGGVFLGIALLSYNREDPSWNTASAVRDTHNWMGGPGASASDLLLQTIGLGGAVFAGVLLTWGISILRRRSIAPFWLRIVGLALVTLTASVAFARIPSGDWLAQTYLGGSAGQIMLQSLADAGHAMGLGTPYTFMALVAGVLAVLSFSLAIAMNREEWAQLLSTTWGFIASTALMAYDRALRFYDWVVHYGDESYIPARPERAAKEKRVRMASEDDEDEEDEEEDEEEEYEDDEEGDEDEEDEEEDEDEEDDDEYEDDDEDDTQLVARAPSNVSAIKVVTAETVSKGARGARQARFKLFDGGEWELPGLDLLQEPPEDHEDDQPDENALRMNAELLQNVLADFNVKGEIVSIHPGPVVTLYELEPAPGTKTARVIGLADDIARSMSAVSVRAAVVPGRNVIGIELPNKKRQTVYLRELLETRDYEKTQAKLPLVLGKDIGGRPIIADLSRMPHLLVAGTTGSGKSVGINTMILSLLYRLPPEKCRFIMIDPKMLELSVYDDIPHLLSPVVTEPGKAVVALKWVVQEMEERYRAMSKLGVRNIDGYNARLGEARKKGEVLMRKVQTGFDPGTGKPVYEEQPLDLTDLPYIVVIVDEFADLMLVAGKDVENAIQRLAQMARAAGIHIIMATQRPSVDVITGVIKANFPTRISFAVTSKIDSRTILGDGGAEQLLGMGDMLYMASGGRITRVHGPFSSDEDVENVVNFLKTQAEPSYLEEVTEGGDFEGSEVMGALFGGDGGGSDMDELYDQAVAIVARERKASTSFIQRHLQIGYNRAARIIEEMEKQGVIGPANHVGKREILVGDHSAA
jgi:S-DNA-T family DNA segregation ATPase FtsK/SpoIIIE